MTFNSEELLFKLLHANSEKDVTRIINSDNEMSNPDNWEFVDRDPRNYSKVSNQASNGAKAFTELPTNSTDAVILKELRKLKIDPSLPSAPQSPYQAVKMINPAIPSGKLSNYDDKNWKSKFASENLIVGLTGAFKKSDGAPCITIVDNGEGQHPYDFENTFCSLSSGYKTGLGCSQGYFTMGGTAPHHYSGTKGYKLILSKKWDKTGAWGWTLIRFRESADDKKWPIEYFALNKITIPNFQKDSIKPFKAFNGKGPDFDGVEIESGTVVKLYDYHFGKEKSQSDYDVVRNIMNENLTETLLPFRLLDFRDKPRQDKGEDRKLGVNSRWCNGLKSELIRMQNLHLSKNPDDKILKNRTGVQHLGNISDIELGSIVIEAIVTGSKMKEKDFGKYRIFHEVNGQNQHKNMRGVLSQWDFPGLMDRVIIFVDASKMTKNAFGNIWKADRERILETQLGEKYQAAVRNIVQNNDFLVELEHDIAREALDSNIETDQIELFQKIIDEDKDLKWMFTGQKLRISNPNQTGGSSTGISNYQGQKSPTFLTRNGSGKLEVPVDSLRCVTAKTDAENGYLSRPVDTGHVELRQTINNEFHITEQLHNGTLTVGFKPKDTALPGDSYQADIGLKDCSMQQSIKCQQFVIEVVNKLPSKKPGTSKRKKEKDNQHGGSDDDDNKIGLPPIHLCTKDGREIDGIKTELWPEWMTSRSGGYVEQLSGTPLIYVNYDNENHLKHRDVEKDDVTKDTVTLTYKYGMAIEMMSFENVLKQMRDGDQESEDIHQHQDLMRRMHADAAAFTVFPISDTLPKIIKKRPVSNNEDIE